VVERTQAAEVDLLAARISPAFSSASLHAKLSDAKLEAHTRRIQHHRYPILVTNDRGSAFCAAAREYCESLRSQIEIPTPSLLVFLSPQATPCCAPRYGSGSCICSQWLSTNGEHRQPRRCCRTAFDLCHCGQRRRRELSSVRQMMVFSQHTLFRTYASTRELP